MNYKQSEGVGLISIIPHQDVKTVDAREVHQMLKVPMRFRDWINRRIQEYGFIEEQDYWVSLKNERNYKGGRSSKEYMITIAMAKELAMVERTATGRKVRQYFIEIERRYSMMQWNGLAVIHEKGNQYVCYLDRLRQLGYSTSSGSVGKRKKQFPQFFALMFGRNFITVGYAERLLKQKHDQQLELPLQHKAIGGTTV